MSNAAAPTVEPATPLVTFEVRVGYMDTFTHEFAKLARKAVKLGVVAPTFTVVQRDKVIPAIVAASGKVERPARTVNVILVSGQAPRLGGWVFAATLQHEAGGNIVRSVPGLDLQIKRDLRSAPPSCEHCGLDRRRADTYVVVHDDGRQVQVGRTCLKDFTGHDSPEAVARWAELLGAFVSACGDDEDRSSGGGGGGASLYATLDEFMPFVCANIRVQGWLSRTAARNSMSGAESTADSSWSSIFPSSPKQKAAAITPEAEDIARAAVCLATARTYFDAHDVDALSDYEHNLRIIVEGVSIDYRTAGIAASLINFAERLMGKEIERRKFEARKVSAEYIGTVGKRETWTLTVEKIIDIDTDFGVSHLHMFCDEAGNAVKWFSTSKRLEVGTTYSVKGTVKKHEEWKGMKQTLLTRCACEKFDPNKPAPAPKKARKPRAKKAEVVA